MATIQYRLSTRVSHGYSEILVRFYDGSVSQRARSHILVPTASWDAEQQRLNVPRKVVPSVAELAKTQRKIDELTDAIYAAWVRDNATVKDGWLQKVIDRSIFGYTVEAYTLKDILDLRLQHCDFSGGTIQRYRVMYGAFERYENAKRKKLMIDKLTASDLEDFERWLACEEIIPSGSAMRRIHRSHNTITSKMKAIAALVHWAVRQGLTTNDPFLRYHVKAEAYGDPIYLNEAEREQLTNALLPAELAVQRDIFIFQCSVGCRVGDLMALTESNLDGEDWIQYIPHKTRKRIPEAIRIPLSPTAKAIIARYRGQPDGRLLPFVHPNVYNKEIHRFCQLAGLNRPVIQYNSSIMSNEIHPLWELCTSHTARRTFAQMMFSATGSERIAASFTGHAPGSRAFTRYSKVDDEMKKKIMETLTTERYVQ